MLNQNQSVGRRKLILTLILLPIISSLLFHLSPASFLGKTIWQLGENKPAQQVKGI